jgi:hypothetical protein
MSSNFQTRHMNAIATVFANTNTWHEAVLAMGEMLAADNPNFIPAPFLLACEGHSLDDVARLRRKIRKEQRDAWRAQWVG